MSKVSFTDIQLARGRISGRVLRTPLRRSASLSERTGAPVLFKHEQLQTTGSFKLRGATNAVLSLTADLRKRGVITVSTGNHGRALAHAASQVGIACTVCVSSLVPRNKVEEISALGARVRIIGRSQDQAEIGAKRLAAEHGMVMVHPFDQTEIIAGQGTLGLELIEEAPETECLVVPLSGGGLAAGVALAAKTVKPGLRVIGVSMARGAAMAASLRAGRPVEVEELPTLADALGGGIGLENRHTFALARDLLDEVVLVEEAEIAAAIAHVWREHAEVVEGAGAVGTAALLADKVRIAGPTIVILSGRNIEARLHGRIIEDHAVTASDLGASE
ncbi:MAG: hydroxyectoine utilization dehydratase EutB [Hyphomicrobiales bacterium]|nr:hydroxyectoine utilization dehydratase EutB [Hyphomicrobiales bacterium]